LQNCLHTQLARILFRAIVFYIPPIIARNNQISINTFRFSLLPDIQLLSFISIEIFRF